MSEKLLKAFDKIELGDHFCSIYQDREQQFVPLIPFFRKGLENNQKCIYIVDDNSEEDIISEFEKRGIKIKDFIKTGQFVILTKRETYLKWGVFSPDKMIQLLKDAETGALEDGYAGVYGTGEMTWQLGNGHITDSTKLIEYEARLNDFIPNSKLAIICQYNENRFRPEILTGVIHTHPWLVIYGKIYENLYFYSPAQYTTKEYISSLVDSYKLMLREILGVNGI